MTAATLAVSLLFTILRSIGSNEKIYSARLYYTTDDSSIPWAPSKDQGNRQPWYAWVKPLLTTQEEVLFDVLGANATVFLRLQRAILIGFGCTAFVAMSVLIPVNVVYNLREVPSGNRSSLSILTSSDVRGNSLFAHIIVSYAINAIFLYLLWKNEARVIQLRQRWFQQAAEDDHLYARSLSIIRIPEELDIKTDDGLGALVSKLGLPHPTTSVRLGRAMGSLPALIKKHDELVVKLEKSLTKYLRGGKLGKKRPLVRLGGWRWLPIGGVKVDAISYYTEQVEELEDRIKGLRDKLDTEAPANYGFVSMASVACAHRNIEYLDKHKKSLAEVLKGAKVAHAPHPKDIVWENIEDRETTQDRKDLAGSVLLAVVFMWWTLPVIVLSFLANLANVATFVPFLQDWQAASNGTFSAVSGILPPAVAALFAFLLPIIIRQISKFQGSTTTTELDRIVAARLFDFTFCSQLLLFSLIAVLFNLAVGMIVQLGQGQSVSTIFHMLDDLPVSISSTYTQEWAYWTTWIPSRGFAAVFDLAQLINLVIVQSKSLILGRRRTPREIRDSMKPKRFKFEIYTSNLIFLSCVGLAYSVLAPLVAGVAFLVLAIWSLVYRYQLMFVFETPNGLESGGRLWPMMVDRLLVALTFSNVLVALTIALSRSRWYFFTLAPPTIVILIFKLAITRRFGHDFKYYTPKDEEHTREQPVHAGDERKKRLARRFEHPAMSAELYTPMLAKDVAHLVPEVYHGNVKTARPTDDKKFSGTRLASARIGRRLKIAAVDESQLEPKPEARDWDGDSSDSSDSDSSGDEAAAPQHRKFTAFSTRLEHVKSSLSGAHLSGLVPRRSTRRQPQNESMEETRAEENT
ncbi:hypothetical protein BCR35DRAFT_24997 [Leucosporidium creatinivorum]|uniref:DUF221-domain-containing protein n=1 Tax=Leucosporidium creatinivorum TaxID=106004 RepID=A0A1Y2CTL8_9BASI|nr:hypothetical protein BCR35DRAFT_24997 [Leucosporidium creatinivorum]